MVLGASQLTLQPAWQAGSGSGAPAAVLPTPSGCLAPLTGGGALLLDDHGAACQLEGADAPAGACSAGGQAILVAGPQALVHAALAPGAPPALRTIDLDAEGSPTCIAEAAALFAVGAGRHVLVLDSQGQQLRRLGPLPAPVQHVCWPGADAAVGLLLAATPTGLHCWRDGGATEGCELAPPTGEPPPEQQPAYACIAAALGAPLVAASCTTANEVHCWDLQSLLFEGEDPGQPLRLQEFEAPVEVLQWDPSGQYLATADGSDCAVWDLSDASGAERGQSIACCGHEARSRITALAFQPEGHLLATASSSGKVALFDCHQFRRGGVLGPVAYAVLDPSFPDAATALAWLPNGRLVVGAASGRLLCLQLSEQSTQTQPAEAAGGAAALADGMAGLSMAPAATDGAAAAAAAEAAPAAAAAAAAGGKPTAADEVSAAAVAAATAAAAAALAGPAGRSCPSAPVDEEATLSSGSLPAAGPSTPRSKGDQEAAAGQYDTGNGSGSGHSGLSGLSGSGHSGSGIQAPAESSVPAFPPGRVPPPINLTRHSSESSSGGGGGGNGGARGRRSARGGAGRSAAGSDPSAPGPGGAGSAGFSASLMHHIQAIRENPPQQGHGRGHTPASSQSPQLAGWGLGSPSGPSFVPWMVGGGQPGAQMGGGPMQGGPMQGGGNGGGGGGNSGGNGSGGGGSAPQGFAAFQAQAAMMQRMAMGPQAQGAFVGAGSPGSPQPAPAFQGQPAMFGGGQPAMAALPMMATAPGGMPVGLAPMGSGGAPGPASMGGGGWVMVAPPAAFMQSMQQWAGTAPGYMVYQHQQAQFGGGGAGGAPRPARLSNTSTGATSPVASGSLSPRGSGGSMGRVASGGLPHFPSRMESLPHFPSRMESALGGVPSSSRQASLDHAAIAALEAAQHSTRGGAARPRNGSSGGGSGSGATAAEASPSARNERELLQQLHAAAAAAEGGASAAAAAARERREEQGNDNQGSATSAAAEAAAVRSGRGGAPPPQRGGSAAGSGSGTSGSGTASASLLSPARSGDLNNIDYAGGGNSRLGGSASYSSSLPELSGSMAADASGAVNTVYVGNLPGTVDEYTLACAFAPFGPITHVQVIKEKGSHLSRGYGFVSYAHPVYATVAMQHMNQQVLFGPFNGSRIKVAPSKRH